MGDEFFEDVLHSLGFTEDDLYIHDVSWSSRIDLGDDDGDTENLGGKRRSKK